MLFKSLLPGFSIFLFYLTASYASPTLPMPPQKVSPTVIQGVIKNYEKYSKTKMYSSKNHWGAGLIRTGKLKYNPMARLRFDSHNLTRKSIFSPLFLKPRFTPIPAIPYRSPSIWNVPKIQLLVAAPETATVF
ncbi:hypothetical protein KUV50_02455 [Membranicola marinus]|uniref:Uncharacterized protein n=1 Tax=Membranihabitans marinus TaxID=1227546 RepID=A0A953HRD3_9BACT|nr:hypothetical protein [Membranihabitans marinus]MBY5956980.1 hypothetical protein [Membranihabitans marinus]